MTDKPEDTLDDSPEDLIADVIEFCADATPEGLLGALQFWQDHLRQPEIVGEMRDLVLHLIDIIARYISLIVLNDEIAEVLDTGSYDELTSALDRLTTALESFTEMLDKSTVIVPTQTRSRPLGFTGMPMTLETIQILKDKIALVEARLATHPLSSD